MKMTSRACHGHRATRSCGGPSAALPATADYSNGDLHAVPATKPGCWLIKSVSPVPMLVWGDLRVAGRQRGQPRMEESRGRQAKRRLAFHRWLSDPFPSPKRCRWLSRGAGHRRLCPPRRRCAGASCSGSWGGKPRTHSQAQPSPPVPSAHV